MLVDKHVSMQFAEAWQELPWRMDESEILQLLAFTDGSAAVAFVGGQPLSTAGWGAAFGAVVSMADGTLVAGLVGAACGPVIVDQEADGFCGERRATTQVAELLGMAVALSLPICVGPELWT